MNNPKKKKILLLTSLIVLLVGFILLLGTYALWQVTEKQTDRNALETACLSITFADNSAGLNQNAMWPTTDSDGANLEPYTFTITNNCDMSVNYVIALEELADTDTQNPVYTNPAYVRVQIDSKVPAAYSSLTDMPDDTSPNLGYTILDTRRLTAKPLGPHASRTHELRTWLAENTPETQMNSEFLSKVKVIGGQGIEVDCFTVDSNGVLTDYDTGCGKEVTIPANVNGVAVREIASDAFKATLPNYTYSGAADGESVRNPYEFKYLNTEYQGGTACANSDNTNFTCTLDYSLVLSSKAAPLFGMQDLNQMAALAATLTADDFYVIKYNRDSSSISYPHLAESIDNMLDFYLNQLSGMGVTMNKNDIKVYSLTNPPDEGTGVVEMYFSAQYNSSNSEWGFMNIGQKFPSGTTSKKLYITSLDLTKATNLERIDNIAFSNFEDLNKFNTLNDISGNVAGINYEPDLGLTYLKYDNKLYNVSLGGAVFGYANLDRLALNTNTSFNVESNYERAGHELTDQTDWTLLEDNNDFWVMTPSDNNYPFTFAYVDKLTINKGGNDTTIDEGQFSWFNRIGFLTIGDGITSIGNDAFGSNRSSSGDPNYSIYGLSLPSSLTSIGIDGLVRYRGKTLNIPSGVTSIARSAFASYNGKTLEIPAGITEIGQNAFEGYQGDSLILHEGLQSISSGAFLLYSNDVTIPYSVTTIETHAFPSLDSNDTVTIKRAQNNVPYDTGYYSFGYYNYNSSTGTGGPTIIYDPD